MSIKKKCKKETVPMFFIFESDLLRAKRYQAGEVNATMWLTREISQNSGKSSGELETICSIGSLGHSKNIDVTKKRGDEWTRYQRGDRCMRIEIRDRIARYAIKHGWLPPVEESRNPFAKRAYGTTAGFDYKNFNGPKDQLSAEEKAHQEQSLKAVADRQLTMSKEIKSIEKAKENAKYALSELIHVLESQDKRTDWAFADDLQLGLPTESPDIPHPQSSFFLIANTKELIEKIDRIKIYIAGEEDLFPFKKLPEEDSSAEIGVVP